MRADELKPLWDWAVRNGADPHQLATLWKEELWIGVLPAVVSFPSKQTAPAAVATSVPDRIASLGARSLEKDGLVAAWNTAIRMGEDPVEVSEEFKANWNAAILMGKDPVEETEVFLKWLESGGRHRRRALGVEARARMAKFNDAAAELRKRYRPKEGRRRQAGQGRLTFGEAVAAFKLLLPLPAGGDVDLVFFSLHFNEVWEVVGRRRDLAKRYSISQGWERHCRFRVIATLIGLARARGEEGEWFAKAQAELDWLKTRGADDRPQGKHDPIVRIGRDVIIAKALAALAECGIRTTSSKAGSLSLADALAEASGIEKREVVMAWERYPLRTRHTRNERNPDPEKPPIVPGVQCAKCGKAGKVPVYRTREGGSRLCTDCCEW